MKQINTLIHKHMNIIYSKSLGIYFGMYKNAKLGQIFARGLNRGRVITQLLAKINA